MSLLNNGQLLNKPLNVGSRWIRDSPGSRNECMDEVIEVLCSKQNSNRVFFFLFFLFGEAVDGCAKCYLTLF